VVKNTLSGDLCAVPRVSGQQDADGALLRLGAAIRQARKDHGGMSQEALADAAGIDRSHMGKIERGQMNVTLLNLVKIAAALNGLPSDLLREAEL
jgi:transcriptional regulator with XRE-family HTH domain